jgi:hypothetical protein
MHLRNLFIFLFILIFFSVNVLAYGFGFTPNIIEFDISNNNNFSQFIVYNSNNFPVILKPINDEYLTLVDSKTLDLSPTLNLTIAPNSNKVFLLKQTKTVKQDINSHLELFLCRLDNCDSGSVFGFILKYHLTAEKFYFNKNEILVLGGNNPFEILKSNNNSDSVFYFNGIIISILIISIGLFIYSKNKPLVSKLITLIK